MDAYEVVAKCYNENNYEPLMITYLKIVYIARNGYLTRCEDEIR